MGRFARLSERILLSEWPRDKGHKEAGAETEEAWADTATETEIEPVAESRQNKTRHNKQTGRLSL